MFMPAAPIPAAEMALANAGIKLADVKAVKTHNPFAVNDVAFAKKTGYDVMKMNNNGSSLIYGHPQGPDGWKGDHRADRGGGAPRRRLRPLHRLRGRRRGSGNGRKGGLTPQEGAGPGAGTRQERKESANKGPDAASRRPALAFCFPCVPSTCSQARRRRRPYPS